MQHHQRYTHSVHRKGLIPQRLRIFMQTELSGGIVMILFATLAIMIANSSLHDWYEHLINVSISFGFDTHTVSEPLRAWVKDILMVFFFLIIGLELKREMKEGFLSRADQVILPLCAAIGGMAIPSLVFFCINLASPSNLVGWAIPSVNDIAFSVCVLLLVATDLPRSIKIFLLAIAIFDDLGAIIVVTLFYNTHLATVPLFLALIGLSMLYLLNRMNVSTFTPYLIVGTYVWFCLFHSGIHTTVAGIAVGLAIPMRNPQNPDDSPLNHFLEIMHPWISFVVLPAVAFTNAGISIAHITWQVLLNPLTLGITLALFLGKQAGIFFTAFMLIKARLVRMPENSTWLQLYGASVISGIGFTMSLFIGLLAFEDNSQAYEYVRTGVIGGSLLSALWGCIIMRMDYFQRHGKHMHAKSQRKPPDFAHHS